MNTLMGRRSTGLEPLFLWSILGLLLGTQLGLWTGRLNEIGGFGLDGLKLAWVTGLAYALAGLVTGAVVLAILSGASRLWSRMRADDPRLHASLASGIASLIALRATPRMLGDGLPIAFALPVAVVLGVILGRVLGALGVRLVFVFVVLAAVVTASAASSRPHLKAAPGAVLMPIALGSSPVPLLVIGLDGFDPGLMEALMTRGELPRLHQLVRRGAYGRVQTLSPTYSPAIWTTIATGQLPDKHGIHEFEAYGVNGLRHPIQTIPRNTGIGRLLSWLESHGYARRASITTSLRRSAALWNIVSAARLRVALVNWWPSWPIEPINGVVVSDRFWQEAQVSSAQGARKHDVISPRGLEDALHDSVVTPDQVPRELVEPLSSVLHRWSRSKRGAPEMPATTLRGVVEILAADLTYEGIARQLLREGRFELFAVYFRATDPISHFGRRVAHELGLESVDEGSRELLRQTIDSYYRIVDARIGSLVDAVGEEAHILVCSDHGFDWNKPGLGDHEHSPPGVLLLAGPAIRSGIVIRDARVVDLAPTALYLLGLPAAKDMDGKVLTDLIKPGDLEARPPRLVETYGSRPVSMPVPSELDNRLRETLRALGYISPR